MTHPCSKCESGYSILVGKNHGRTVWFCRKDIQCAKLEKYKAKLYAKRQYRRGEPITSPNQLAQTNLCWLWEKPVHHSVVESMQYRHVIELMNDGRLFAAELKEDA